MEFVLIIKVEDHSIAADLNTRGPHNSDPNKKEGIKVISEHGFRELNNNDGKLHGKIQSRVFYCQDCNPGDPYTIKLSPYQDVTRRIPDNREFEIVDYPPKK